MVTGQFRPLDKQDNSDHPTKILPTQTPPDSEKNCVIMSLIVESLLELKFDPTSQVKMTQFFLSVHREKSHIDLKS